ncbi:MAG: hypothetical protein N2376_11740, partial [Clostridia bacterium]|nr:hypothetical protein [Clostridia bacterium]
STLEKIERILDTAVSHTVQYASSEFGFSMKSPSVHFLTCTPLIDTDLVRIIHESICPDAPLSAVSGEGEAGNLLPDYVSVSSLGMKHHTFDSNASLVFSWLCDQADLAIVLSDDHNPFILDFVRACKQQAVPAVVLGLASESPMLWTEKSYYDSYEDEKLRHYLDTLMVDILPHIREEHRVLGQRLLWGNLYKKYLKKYKATVDTSKPFTKDTIIDADCTFECLDEPAKATRSSLLEWFYHFDAMGIHYADKYKSSIYLRAVIPLFVTLALAVGFYIETLMSPWSVTLPGTRLQLWSLVAGIGFFTNVMLNLYVYRLSENPTVHSWHKSFIDNRFIAETLRMAVHFIPFGIPVNYLSHVSHFGANKKNVRALHRLKCILKEVGLPKTNFCETLSTGCLNSLEELVDDQIEYHKASANRYVKIYNTLKRFGKTVFYIGFSLVLMRGCIQLYLSFSSIQGEWNGKAVQPILKAFTNMLALVFPAWAGYFTSKLSLCNFEGLYNNDTTMIEGLMTIKRMIEDERRKGALSYGDLYSLSRNVTALLLGEVSEWYSQINTRTVTKL